jgi:hypothetical protein
MNWFKIPGMSSKGDIATVLIIGTAGFVIDLHLMPLGVPAGTTAGLFASGSLGAKKLIESLREEITKEDKYIALFSKIKTFISMLRKSRDCKELVERLEKGLRLYEGDLIGIEELNELFLQIRKGYIS